LLVPPHRLIVSSAATKYIIHYPLGFVNAFFKFLKIFPAGRISAAEKRSNIKDFCPEHFLCRITPLPARSAYSRSISHQAKNSAAKAFLSRRRLM